MSSPPSNRIVERALELGFDRVGVVPLESPTHLDAFDRWLAAGRHGEMAYMARHRDLRADPRRLHVGARSAVVVAMNHNPPNDPERTGGVARYARGRDYHTVMRKRLARLGRFIDDELGAGACQPRACVDSAPVLERDLAEKAGLGWFGKSTNIINQALGSYLFLGELLVGHELQEVRGEAPDRCGRCTACIDLCPTGAIVAPYEVDARLCISYLTIELRGPIPRPLRPLIGDHLFGCDICQIVCPWNHKAPAGRENAFRPRPEVMSVTAPDLLRMPEGEFEHLFRGSPIRRTGRASMARNAAIVLANAGDRAAGPLLVAAMREDPSALVRGHAAWSVGRLGGSAGQAALELARLREGDGFVLEEIDAALESGAAT